MDPIALHACHDMNATKGADAIVPDFLLGVWLVFVEEVGLGRCQAKEIKVTGCSIQYGMYTCIWCGK